MNYLRYFTLAPTVLLSVCVAGCGLGGSTLLETTITAATGGSGSLLGNSHAGQPPVLRPSPFCSFMWGRSWGETNADLLEANPPLPVYQNNLDMVVIWVGYEQDDLVNDAIRRMLAAISPSGMPELQGAVPVFYSYFIPFKSRNKAQLEPCAPTSSTPNICTKGAQWVRDNRDYLRSVYDYYAKSVAAMWGTTKPIVWFFEPGFNDYIRESQENPLSLQELSIVASDLIGTIKARMPNALISHFVSPEVSDFGEYFGTLDLSQIDMVNVTGAADSEYFKEEFRQKYPQATYRNLHDASGLPILVDTGFGASLVANHGWLTVEPSVINQRIAEGVIGVQVEPPTEAEQSRINAVNPHLTPLSCAP